MLKYIEMNSAMIGKSNPWKASESLGRRLEARAVGGDESASGSVRREARRPCVMGKVRNESGTATKIASCTNVVQGVFFVLRFPRMEVFYGKTA